MYNSQIYTPTENHWDNAPSGLVIRVSCLPDKLSFPICRILFSTRRPRSRRVPTLETLHLDNSSSLRFVFEFGHEPPRWSSSLTALPESRSQTPIPLARRHLNSSINLSLNYPRNLRPDGICSLLNVAHYMAGSFACGSARWTRNGVRVRSSGECRAPGRLFGSPYAIKPPSVGIT